MRTIGEIAYDGYCAKTGFKSLVSKEPLPAWGKLKLEIQQAWEAAAMAVYVEMLEEVQG